MFLDQWFLLLPHRERDLGSNPSGAFLCRFACSSHAYVDFLRVLQFPHTSKGKHASDITPHWGATLASYRNFPLSDWIDSFKCGGQIPKGRRTFKNVILQIQGDESTWKSCLQLPKNIENNQLITDCRCKRNHFPWRQPALQTAEINSFWMGSVLAVDLPQATSLTLRFASLTKSMSP